MGVNVLPSCPSAEQLAKLLSPELPEDERARMDDHLKGCNACDSRFRAIRHSTETRIFGQSSSSDSRTAATSDIPIELQNHPRFRVIKFLGGGGMGMVFLAEHRLLERPIVLKLIRPNLLEREEVVERFRRESRLAAKLAHPNIVAVYEAEQIDKLLVLVMEYIVGTPLSAIAASEKRLPIGQACELVRQAAFGLQHIHEKGLVHRDVKPSNLLVTPQGQVKILDMGLAILKAEHAAGGAITGEMQMLGTIDYAAPEQWGDSRAVDIRADIYSLGCTLYHLLAGGTPFSDTKFSTIMKKMWAHGYAPVPPLRDVRPEIPRELAAIVDKMLAKDRDARFAAPIDVADALAPFCEEVDLADWLPNFDKAGQPRSSAPTLAGKDTKRSTGRFSKSSSSGQGRLWSRRWLIGAAGSAMLGLAGYAWRAYRRGDQAAAGRVKPIRVGVLHSLSGTMMQSEAGVVDATLLAIKEINDAGGLLGRPVEPVVVDGQSEPAVFAREAQRLVASEKVAVVFGCWTSASRKTVRPVFERGRHLLVYPVQYEGLEDSRNIVYLGAAPNQQIVPAVRWAFGALGKKFFLVGSDYVFPRTANAIMRDEILRLGGEVVDERYLLLGSTVAADAVKRIVESKPSVILNTINGDTNTAFFRALRAAGVTPARIPTMSFSIAEPELGSLRIADMVGDYAAWNYFQTVDRPENRAFVASFRSLYGPQRVISDPMEAAYCGVHLWAKAVAAAETAEVGAVRARMLQESFDAPGGAIRIDPETQHTWKIARIGRINEQGNFEIVNSSGAAVKPEPYPTSRTRPQWDAFLRGLQDRWAGKWYNDGTRPTSP